MNLLLALACTWGRPDTPDKNPAPLVLFVSFDTTRADAISAYGRHGRTTPTIDALAEKGLRFEWALAHAPTTLSSHTSVFSGMDSHGHGVVANGYPISGEIELVTEQFRDAGWDTLAVLGSSALEKSMGLDRGFRIYNDDMSTHTPPRYENPGDRVTELALEAIDQRQDGKPVFLFVHYFDAHGPWNSAPDRIRKQFIDPAYDGEVDGERDGTKYLVHATRRGTATPGDGAQAQGLYHADVHYSDEQLGVLLKGLEERKMLDDSLIVVFGDHGEAMDEEPQRPYGHGFDVDLFATHVPLVMAGRGKYALPQGMVIDEPVRLMDLGHTVAKAAGITSQLGQAIDLSPSWSGGKLPSLPSFAEATKPRSREEENGWNNLPFERAVALDGHLFVKAPWLGEDGTLYKIAPGQPEVEDPERAKRMDALLEEWDSRAPGSRDVDMSSATIEALKSLGYIDDE